MEQQALIDEIVKLSLEKQRKEAGGGRLARCQHSVGFVVNCRFTVQECPAPLQRGLFAEPRTYEGVARFSISEERTPAAWGLGIKLDCEQDFLLSTGGAFFARDLEASVDLTRAMAQGTPLDYFFPSKLKPQTWRIEEYIKVFSETHPRASGFLNAEYNSQTSYTLGTDAVVRYVVRQPGRNWYLPNMRKKGLDYFERGLRKFLPETLSFYVQLDPFEVDDPTLVWPKHISPLHHVADVMLYDGDAVDEGLAFSVANTWPEHAPVGKINAAREASYHASAVARGALPRNGSQP